MLQRPLLAALAELKSGDVVMEVATPVVVEPEPVTKGGPVTSGAKVAPDKKAAKPTAKEIADSTGPAVMVGAPRGVAPAPKVTTPPKPVAKPVATAVAAPPTLDQAVATIEEVLGGEVVTESAEEHHDPTTPVVENPVPEAAAAELAEEANPNRIDASCGDRRFIDTEAMPWPEGFEPCHREMVLITDGNHFLQVLEPEGQRPDLVEIGALRTRAILCNPCYQSHRQATNKAKEAANA